MGYLLVLRFYFSRFDASQGLVLVSAHSILFIPIFQCDLGGIICLGGLDFLVGCSICGFVLVATFFLPEVGICISLL